MIRSILFLCLLVHVYVEAATVSPLPTRLPSCPMDYQCSRGQCCRDSSGNIVSSQSEHGFPFGPNPFNSLHNGGSCSTKLAQSNEICDSDCQCEPGYECYRPVSGICCPPMKCYNATWVKQQRDYWAKCMMDPHCGLPP